MVKLYEKAMLRVIPEPNTGCWLWMGGASDQGYGQVYQDGRAHYVHRIVATHHYGPIPDGMVVDHKCRMRLCCNPDHLGVVTHRENTMRGTNPSAEKARKTHYLNGHAFTSENTRISKLGTRNCRTCTRRTFRKTLLAKAGA